MKRILILLAVALAACNCEEKPVPDKPGDIDKTTVSPWSVIGTIGGSSWDTDITMYVNAECWAVAPAVSIGPGEQFKFRKNAGWDVNMGYGTFVDGKANTVSAGQKLSLTQGAGNITIAAGSYDIWLAPDVAIAYILPAGEKFTHQEEGKLDKGGDLQGDYKTIEPSAKKAGITYQINVYSFADSDGDGWGDFQGIIDHLDYLDALGVSALWLSPIHPAMSYHGYDITDYSAVNPRFGTEAKLKELIDAAAAKNIDIYLDYVLNHAGKDHPYFLQACKDPYSQWRQAFIFSKDPKADIAAGKIPMIPASDGYDAGQWFPTPAGSTNLGYSGKLHFRLDATNASSPRLTVTQTSDSPQSDNSDSSVNWYIYDNNAHRMYSSGSGIYEITLNVNNSWGVLVKDHPTEWDDHKWGAASGDQTVVFGTPKTLVNGAAANDLTFGAVEYYHSHLWTDWFADWNYGSSSTAETSAAFIHLASTADKWINMGVNGLRLDAVKHIYHNESNLDNPVFLAKWYDRCNTTYKARGGKGDIYMVGEVFSDANSAAQYYKGLPSCFGFSYWWDLRDAINAGRGDGFAAKVAGYRQKFESQYKNRFYPHSSGLSDAIKLSNHDEDRAASSLGLHPQKIRLAAAVLLTSAGKPFIYQGEELGYWGTKKNGSEDEWMRAPIKWSRIGKLPTAALGSRVDMDMLSDDICVDAQVVDQRSLLQLYRHFAYARNVNPALADGLMVSSDSGNSAVASWYMNSTSTGKKCLVMHNFSGADVTVTRSSDNLSNILVANSSGEIKIDGSFVTLPPYSSIVFALN
ncbi:MAG: alpha-amylase [Bacteroidales bacterium]|nr:alpha-amylase [Bacteroidales bacterium]